MVQEGDEDPLWRVKFIESESLLAPGGSIAGFWQSKPSTSLFPVNQCVDRIETKIVVVVEILVSHRQRSDLLTQPLRGSILYLVGDAEIGETTRKSTDDAEAILQLPKYQRTGSVATEMSAAEIGCYFSRSGLGTQRIVGYTLG